MKNLRGLKREILRGAQNDKKSLLIGLWDKESGNRPRQAPDKRGELSVRDDFLPEKVAGANPGGAKPGTI